MKANSKVFLHFSSLFHFVKNMKTMIGWFRISSPNNWSDMYVILVYLGLLFPSKTSNQCVYLSSLHWLSQHLTNCTFYYIWLWCQTVFHCFAVVSTTWLALLQAYCFWMSLSDLQTTLSYISHSVNSKSAIFVCLSIEETLLIENF